MTAEQIINTFELQVDDLTELATSEELKILNRVYKRVCAFRPWEFLKKEASGAILSDSEGSYITLPADFYFLSETAQYTDNTIEWQGNNSPRLIYVNGDKYKVVNFSDRRQYTNQSNVAYVNLTQNKIRFMTTVSGNYDFDYIYLPADLTLIDSPVFPPNFHDFLAYGMAVENDILQLSEKARAYTAENDFKFNSDLKNLEYYNANQRYD